MIATCRPVVVGRVSVKPPREAANECVAVDADDWVLAIFGVVGEESAPVERRPLAKRGTSESERKSGVSIADERGIRVTLQSLRTTVAMAGSHAATVETSGLSSAYTSLLMVSAVQRQREGCLITRWTQRLMLAGATTATGEADGRYDDVLDTRQM